MSQSFVGAHHTPPQSRSSTNVVQHSEGSQSLESHGDHKLLVQENSSGKADPQAEGVDTISRCFNEAIIRFNRSLLEESKSEWKRLHINLDANLVEPTITLQTLIRVAETARSKYLGNGFRKRSTSVFDEILCHLNRYARSIDVLIQHDPTVSSLVWGSVRALLEVASDNRQASELAADGVLVIVQHMDLWNKIAALFGHEAGTREALTNLYFYIIDFLMHALERFQKRSIERFGLSLRSAEKKRFEERLRNLQGATNRLQWMAQMESNGSSKLRDEWTQNKLTCIEHTVRTQERTVSAPARLQGHPQHNTYIKEWIGGLANCITDANPASTVTADNQAPPWVVKEPQLLEWLNGAPSAVLWVTGKPGSGKSHLSYRLADALKNSNSSDTVITHRFQSRCSALQRSRNSLAFSIIDQVWTAEVLDSLPDHALRKLSTLYCHFRKDPIGCGFSELWEVCTDLLEVLNNYVLIIDGMDECCFDQAQDGRALVEGLEQLSKAGRGKIIIFCRPSFLLDVGTTSYCRPNEIRITPEKTKVELRQFCVGASQQLDWDAELQTQALHKVEAEAQGSFQWATLRFGELKRIHRNADIHLRMNAKKGPSTFEELYRAGVDQITATAKNEDTDACRLILLALLGRRRVLTLEELSDATGLIFAHIGPIITEWLQPFVSVDEGNPNLLHPTVRDFLLENDYTLNAQKRVSFLEEDPDSFMAERCLECLLEKKYGDPNRIARRLRAKFGLEMLDGVVDGTFYDYAAHNWVAHLVQLDKPSMSLLRLVGKFLRSLQFSHWAEFVFEDGGEFQAIRSAQMRLVDWSRCLQDHDRALLNLNDYFEAPYKALNEVYKSREEDDRTLPWLPLIQLGFYYFDSGRINEMQTIRTYIAHGLSDVLGKKHPLALRARSEAAFGLLSKGRLAEAHTIWASVAADQREVMPEGDRTELYRTLFYQGLAEYHMNDYATALRTFAYVSAKLLSSKGPTSNPFLVAELWYSQVNAAKGELQKSIERIEDIRKTREELYGADDAFAALTKILLSDIYRKCDEQTRSLEYLKEALKQRKRLWSVTHPLIIDASIRLVITYRDFDFEDEAWEEIDNLEEYAQLEEEDKFYELCQTLHLKALLLLGDGNTDEAISILQQLLISTEPEQVIRPLQWVRTDLADMLRYRDHEGDKDTANALFDGVIVDKEPKGGGNGKHGEPDPPRQLHIAEEALRTCRAEGLSKAEALLDKEGFKWKLESSLWLIFGMPGADTTVMKPPRGLGNRSLRDEPMSDEAVE